MFFYIFLSICRNLVLQTIACKFDKLYILKTNIVEKGKNRLVGRLVASCSNRWLMMFLRFERFRHGRFIMIGLFFAIILLKLVAQK